MGGTRDTVSFGIVATLDLQTPNTTTFNPPTATANFNTGPSTPPKELCRSSQLLGMGTDGHGSIKGADSDDKPHDGEPQRGRGRNKLSPTLQIPKNRSTGNLAVVSEDTEALDRQQESTSRVRFSFDAGSGLSADYDSVTRCENVPIPPPTSLLLPPLRTIIPRA